MIKALRGIGFEDAVGAILSGRLIATVKHPNQKKYPNQKIFIVIIQNYCYAVPYVENDDTFFLKTLYPSRKASKKYLKRKDKKG